MCVYAVVCVCVCNCMCVCMQLYVCVYVIVCVCTFVRLFLRVFVRVHMSAGVPACGHFKKKKSPQSCSWVWDTGIFAPERNYDPLPQGSPC